MTKKITATEIRGYLRARFREINNNKKNKSKITMKTFATLALLGLAASAIKLTQDDAEFEISEDAWFIAEEIMWECDADGD